MYTCKFNGHQGDVEFFSIDSVEKGFEKVEKTFFAKSEKSGHCHALCGNYELYVAKEEDVFIIKVKEGGATLNHTSITNLTKEYWDKNEVLPVADHQATLFEEGIYKIGIQQRKRPFSDVWEKVID